jgi:hypothetical protein
VLISPLVSVQSACDCWAATNASTNAWISPLLDNLSMCTAMASRNTEVHL